MVIMIMVVHDDDNDDHDDNHKGIFSGQNRLSEHDLRRSPVSDPGKSLKVPLEIYI